MKVDDFTLVKADPELVSVIDNIINIINNGRYVLRVVTSIPDWDGEEGEELLYYSGSTKRRYHYVDGGWWYVNLTQ